MEKLLPVTILDWIITIVTILAIVILIVETLRKRGTKSQSFFTYLLWAILDILVFITSTEEKSSSLILVGGGAVCSIFLSLLLIKYDKSKKWTGDETQATIIIFFIVFLWRLSGSNLLGLTLAIIAEIIAGWPQMKRSWINPGTRLTLISYVLFLISYVLAIFNSPDWQIKNILFPIVFLLYCIGDTLPLIKKWWQIKKRFNLIQKMN